jgi:DNA-binding NarL/FixJ family response regulator
MCAITRTQEWSVDYTCRAYRRIGWVVGEDRDTNAHWPIRVLLADDHTMFRQGLARILASYGGMEIVAEVPNDAEALELAGELSPEVVIMQVQMPFERAVATLEAMRAFPDPPKVVIVTMFESPRFVRGLTGVGASAYVLKTSSSEHLVAAVRAAAFDPASENLVVGMPREGCWRAPRREPKASSRPESLRSCSWRPAASPTARSAKSSTSRRPP